MSGYLMKARLAPSFAKKIMSLDCLTVMVFSQNHCLQKVFKMITAAACEGPGRCVRQLNKILFPVFPPFSILLQTNYITSRKIDCFAVNWFRQIWKCKKSLSCWQNLNLWLPKDQHPSQLSYKERLVTTHTSINSLAVCWSIRETKADVELVMGLQ